MTIISKADHSVISSTNYDVYGSQDDSNNMAAAMNGITREQIGIIASYDAWIRMMTEDLRAAMQRVGLYKGANANGGHRSPYVAIFAAANNNGSATAVEVLYSADGNNPHAEIRGWLMDGGFMATGAVANALTSPEGRYAAVTVAQNGSVGVGTTSPAEKMEVNGRVKSGTLTTGPWPANGEYVFFGTNELNQSNAGNYALLQASTTSNDVGRTYLNSPVDIRFRIGNSDKMILANDGSLTAGDGTNGSLLKLNTERAWEFKSAGSGGDTSLQLQSLVNNKNFDIVSDDGTLAMRVRTSNGGGQVQARLWYSQEYTWSQGDGPVQMGPTDRTVAFLTYVRGKFEGGGEYVRVYAQNGYWYLGGGSAQHSVMAKARCIGMDW